MKLTKLRNKDGEKFSWEELESISRDLQNSIGAAGYESEACQVNSTCIKIGLHKRSFSVVLARHGYNTQHGMGGAKRRTNLPSWDQRVDFNNIINSVLDDHQASCNIKSGEYIIRQGTKSFTGEDWEYQKPEWQIQNEMRGYYVSGGDYKLKTA